MIRRCKLPPDVKIKQWGHGPWVREPDEVEFDHEGIECRLIRSCEPVGKGKKEFLYGGHWAGFVSVPKKHPAYDAPAIITTKILGGIKHDVPSGKDHWVGIEANNPGDAIPSKEKKFKSWLGKLRPEYGDHAFDDPIYRDVDFMIEQVKLLAEQIKSECENG